MSEMLELGMIVDAVTEKKSGDKSGVTVVLKGQKTVTHETGNGYDMEYSVSTSGNCQGFLDGCNILFFQRFFPAFL